MAQGLRPGRVPGEKSAAQPGRAGRVGQQPDRGPGPGPVGPHVPVGQAERHRHGRVPVRPARVALPVPARRRVGPHVQDPVGGRRRVPGPGGGGQRRRRRRPEDRELHADPGRGRRRVQGVHGRMGAPEHAVLGHQFGSGRGRGARVGAVRVRPPPAQTQRPARRQRAADRAAVRHQRAEQRLVGRRPGQQQVRTRRPVVLVMPGRKRKNEILKIMRVFNNSIILFFHHHTLSPLPKRHRPKYFSFFFLQKLPIIRTVFY